MSPRRLVNVRLVELRTIVTFGISTPRPTLHTRPWAVYQQVEKLLKPLSEGERATVLLNLCTNESDSPGG